jgi:hypothetical protein
MIGSIVVPVSICEENAADAAPGFQVLTIIGQNP